MFFGVPIFIMIMSGMYLWKNPTGKEYFKSLLIPLSYVALFGTYLFIWLFNFAKGEEGMVILFVIPVLLGTFILIVISNVVILFIRKNKIQNNQNL